MNFYYFLATKSKKYKNKQRNKEKIIGENGRQFYKKESKSKQKKERKINKT